MFSSYDQHGTAAGAAGPTSATVTIRGAVLKYMKLVVERVFSQGVLLYGRTVPGSN